MTIERTGEVVLPAPGITRRLWPLLLLLSLAAAGYALGLHRHLNLAWLIDRQGALRSYVASHPLASPLVFMAAYAAMVACAIPGGVVFSTAAGLLFGVWAGALYVVLAVTAGASVLLLAARSALRPLVERHAGAMLGRIVAAIDRDGFSYLLAARLLPFAPFWMTNLAAALTRLRLAPFALATVIGIAPITVVLTATGAGIGQTLDAGGEPSFAGLLRPQIVIPLALLAVVSLAPVAFRRYQAGRKSGTER